MKPITTGYPDEMIIGKGQEEYIPLPAVFDGEIIHTKWQLGWFERLRVMISGHIYLQVMTHGKPLQPVRLTVLQSWK